MPNVPFGLIKIISPCLKSKLKFFRDKGIGDFLPSGSRRAVFLSTQPRISELSMLVDKLTWSSLSFSVVKIHSRSLLEPSMI